MHKAHTAEFDFSQITENIFLGTNLCCQQKDQTKILQEIGITADIDLEEERQELPPKIYIYLWLPVQDKKAPSESQVKAGVNMIQNLVSMNKKVFVHCKLGHGRSPTLVAAYLMSTGMSLDQALKTIKDARPEIHIEECQLELLKNYEKNH
jgi:protein-tyrosine phosphatase